MKRSLRTLLIVVVAIAAAGAGLYAGQTFNKPRTPEGVTAAALPGLRSEPGVLAVDQAGRVVTLLVDGSAELVVDRARHFASAAAIEVLPATLRDLFLGLTRSADVA